MARSRQQLATASLTLCVTVCAMIAVVVTGIRPAAASDPDRVTIFAAASLKNALDDAVTALLAETGIKATAVYAGSSALARQIEAGAPADLFISADESWMNYLADKDLIIPASRHDLLTNTLVLIAPKHRPVSLSITKGFALAAALNGDRLALANSESVPAGRYAKAALQSLEVWDSIKGLRAETENVRAALALVASGETPLGIVYKTDAIAEAKVVVVDAFPPASHPAIIYPIARVHGDRPKTEIDGHQTAAPDRALAFLTGKDSMTIFARHGFAAAPAASQDPAP